MKKNGFAVTGMIYSILIIVLILIVSLLALLLNRKGLFKSMKSNATYAIENGITDDTVDPLIFIESTSLSDTQTKLDVYVDDADSGVNYLIDQDNVITSLKTSSYNYKDTETKILLLEDIMDENRILPKLENNFSNITINSTITYSEIIAGNYDVIISNKGYTGSNKTALIESLYTAGENVLTISNVDNYSIIDTITTNTDGNGSATKKYTNEVTTNEPLIIIDQGTHSKVINFIDDVKVFYNFKVTDNTEYDSMGFINNDADGRWLHSNIATIELSSNVVKNMVYRASGKKELSEVINKSELSTLEYKVYDLCDNFAVGVMPIVDLVASTTDILHIHSGSTTSGGGCYGTSSSSTITYSCGAYNVEGGTGDWLGQTGTWTYDAYSYYEQSGCSACHRYHNDYTGNQWTAYCAPICGTCTKSVTTYSTNCGLTTSSVMATIQINKHYEDGIYTLVATNYDNNAKYTNATYTWNTGETDTATVTGNGTYTLSVYYKDYLTYRTKTITYTVTDFDTILEQS